MYMHWRTYSGDCLERSIQFVDIRKNMFEALLPMVRSLPPRITAARWVSTTDHGNLPNEGFALLFEICPIMCARCGR